MKALVTYLTKTGNTLRIAEAIHEVIPCEKEILPFDKVDSFDGFDLIFIGFPVMQFGPPAPARKLISTHASGKNIALFITHAMLSNGNDPNQQSMLIKELDNCRSICSHANLLGLYHCQGELSAEIADQLIASGIPMLMAFAGMQNKTLGHPNASEIGLAKDFASSFFRK